MLHFVNYVRFLHKNVDVLILTFWLIKLFLNKYKNYKLNVIIITFNDEKKLMALIFISYHFIKIESTINTKN